MYVYLCSTCSLLSDWLRIPLVLRILLINVVSLTLLLACIHSLFANRKETRLNMVAVMFQACKPALFYAFIGVVNLLLFSTYILTTGNSLTPAIVFTTISLMSSVRITTSAYLLNAVVGFQEAKVALSRIQVSARALFSGTWMQMKRCLRIQAVKSS